MTLDSLDIEHLTTHPLPPIGVSVASIGFYRLYLGLVLAIPTLDDDDARALIAAHNRKHGQPAGPGQDGYP